MVLGNRDEYPAYKFPMQLVEVICRKDIGEDLGDDAPELDEIKDPDAILYDCKSSTSENSTRKRTCLTGLELPRKS